MHWTVMKSMTGIRSVILSELMATCVLAWKRQQPFSQASTKFIEHMKCFLGMSEL